MANKRRGKTGAAGAVVGLLLALCAGSVGCHSTTTPLFTTTATATPIHPMGKELSKVVQPEYVIEPPDILTLDALYVVPKPPYRVAPLDALVIQVANAFPTDPIAGLYPVEPDGTINLGAAYGKVRVDGMTIEEAKAAIEKHLRRIIKDPQVIVSLGQYRGLQQVRGPHLVNPDGTVRLGIYGAVRVAGMTLAQARAAIEAYLSNYLQNPEISVDIGSYNSKVYYVVFDGGGNGQTVLRLPVVGGETVLDAVSQAGGLTAISSPNRIWIARPAPPGAPCDQILPVDWNSIVRRGQTATNYQLMPGDRIFVQADPLIIADLYLAKVFAPFERVSGFALLVTSAVRTLTGQFNQGNGTSGF
jgi:polysaccharide export outer membrane protein